MPTKRDIGRLLKKGLSGLEAGRLVVKHCSEVDRGEKGFLGELDIAHIKKGLRTREDGDTYNSIVEAYLAISTMLKETHILALSIALIFSSLRSILYEYWLDWHYRFAQADMPVFMTRGQLHAARRRHKADKFQELTSLREILETRAYELAPQEQREECDLDASCLADGYPDLLDQAREQVAELIRSGKLKPVRLPKRDIEALEELGGQIKLIGEKLSDREGEAFQAGVIVIGERDAEAEALREEFDALYREKDEVTKRAYRAAKRRKTHDAPFPLERLEGVHLDSEEADRILDYTYCSGKDLYEAELPEWVEWIDQVSPDLFRNVAVIQDPPSHIYKLHEDGYYQLDLIRPCRTELVEPDSYRTLVDGSRTLRALVNVFLNHRNILEAVSQVIGIQLTRDLDDWYGYIEDKVRVYNDRIRFEIEVEGDGYKVKYVRQDLTERLEPVQLALPSPDDMRTLREEVAAALGL